MDFKPSSSRMGSIHLRTSPGQRGELGREGLLVLCVLSQIYFSWSCSQELKFKFWQCTQKMRFCQISKDLPPLLQNNYISWSWRVTVNGRQLFGDKQRSRDRVLRWVTSPRSGHSTEADPCTFTSWGTSVLLSRLYFSLRILDEPWFPWGWEKR